MICLLGVHYLTQPLSEWHVLSTLDKGHELNDWHCPGTDLTNSEGDECIIIKVQCLRWPSSASHLLYSHYQETNPCKGKTVCLLHSNTTGRLLTYQMKEIAIFSDQKTESAKSHMVCFHGHEICFQNTRCTKMYIVQIYLFTHSEKEPFRMHLSKIYKIKWQNTTMDDLYVIYWRH